MTMMWVTHHHNMLYQQEIIIKRGGFKFKLASIKLFFSFQMDLNNFGGGYKEDATLHIEGYHDNVVIIVDEIIIFSAYCLC